VNGVLGRSTCNMVVGFFQKVPNSAGFANIRPAPIESNDKMLAPATCHFPGQCCNAS
jgi:hypothetical protein